MKAMWIKIVLMTAVSLQLAACGKKKSDEASVQAAPQTQQSEQKQPDQDTPDKDASVEKTPTTSGETSATDSKSENKDQDSAVEDLKRPQVSTPGHQDVQKAPKQEKTESLGSDDKYSGAADDYLRTLLKAKEEQLSETQRNANKKAALSIQSTTLRIDSNNTGDVALSVVIKSGKDSNSILLGGIMKADRTSQLKSAKHSLTAQLKCMDIGMTCETALVTLKMNQAAVNIIFRRTNMEATADFGHKQCLTQACEDIFSVFKQTEEGIKDVKNIVVQKLESTEIIGGRSSFRGILTTAGNESVVIGGDLLNEEVYPAMNLQADRTMKVEDLVDLSRMKNLKDNLHKSLSDVRIVGNDGLGTIRMRVNMKMLDNGTRDVFDLTFKRISLPISSMAIKLN